MLARAQLALGEPAADIARPLTEYVALLERAEYRLFEGELHELRVRLAIAKATKPRRPPPCDAPAIVNTRLGMTAHAARVLTEMA